MSSQIDMEHVFGALAKVTQSWPGQPVGPGGVIRQQNLQSSRPAVLWVFNAEHEVRAFGDRLDDDQPFYALRSLNVIMEPTVEREGVAAALTRHYAQFLSGHLAQNILLIGGNCQSASMAVQLANHLSDMGKTINAVAVIDAVPQQSLEIPLLMNFGVRSPERNPFVEDRDAARAICARQFKSFAVASLPGGHGNYFDPDAVRALLRNLEEFIGTRISRPMSGQS